MLVVLVHKPVHVDVSIAVRLVDFKIKQLGVIDAKPAVKTAHSNDFINHVQFAAWDFSTMVLVSNHFRRILVFRSF